MPASSLTPVPSVVILMAVYNGRAWLAEQLESVFLQKGVALEVFVSIDPSQDGTAEWLKEYALKEPRLQILPELASSGSATQNFFRLLRDVKVEGYDYVAFADQDDIWCADHLLRGVERLQQGYAGYSSNVMAFWPDGRKKLIKKSQPLRRWDFMFESSGPGCTFVMTAGFVRAVQASLVQHRDALQDFGYHDWFVYGFARAQGYRWFIDDYPGVLYRQHDENVVGANTGLAAFWTRARYIGSGAGFSQALLLAEVTGLGDSSFVRSWRDGTRKGFFRLALQANQCRRRFSERCYFFLLCLYRVIFPSS